MDFLSFLLLKKCLKKNKSESTVDLNINGSSYKIHPQLMLEVNPSLYFVRSKYL